MTKITIIIVNHKNKVDLYLIPINLNITRLVFLPSDFNSTGALNLLLTQLNPSCSLKEIPINISYTFPTPPCGRWQKVILKRILCRNPGLKKNTRGQVFPYFTNNIKVLPLRVHHVGLYTYIFLLIRVYQSMYVRLFIVIH